MLEFVGSLTLTLYTITKYFMILVSKFFRKDTFPIIGGLARKIRANPIIIAINDIIFSLLQVSYN